VNTARSLLGLQGLHAEMSIMTSTPMHLAGFLACTVLGRHAGECVLVSMKHIVYRAIGQCLIVSNAFMMRVLNCKLFSELSINNFTSANVSRSLTYFLGFNVNSQIFTKMEVTPYSIIEHGEGRNANTQFFVGRNLSRLGMQAEMKYLNRSHFHAE